MINKSFLLHSSAISHLPHNFLPFIALHGTCCCRRPLRVAVCVSCFLCHYSITKCSCTCKTCKNVFRKSTEAKKNIYIGINPRRELCEGYYAVQNIFFICKTPLSCSHFSYLFFSLLRCIAGASNSERSHLKRSINKDICVSLYNQYCSLIQCSSAV